MLYMAPVDMSPVTEGVTLFKYLTIIRRWSEYWWIFPETKSRGISTNIHEPEVNNCFSIINQVIIEIPEQQNFILFDIAMHQSTTLRTDHMSACMDNRLFLL